jgi:hypothetical protein
MWCVNKQGNIILSQRKENESWKNIQWL